MTTIKQRYRKIAQPAEPKKRICVCPCRREFIVTQPKRKFYGMGCQYRYRRHMIDMGCAPPEMHVICSICGKWFPSWRLIHTGREKTALCDNHDCRKARRRIGGGGSRQQTSAIKQSPKKVAWVRAEYCSADVSKHRPECVNYSKCLEPVQWGGPIFIRYFETKGTCRMWPESYIEKMNLFSK